MNTFSKTLNVEDYQFLSPYTQAVSDVIHLLEANNVSHGAVNHQHRNWEYSMIYKAIDLNGAKTVLDIGGAGASFSPTIAKSGREVHQLDLGNALPAINEQNRFFGVNMTFDAADFVTYTKTKKYDAVVAISVIEHVVKDKVFFKKMLNLVKDGGLVCLTTDFHPSGLQIVPFHERTYNKESLMELADIAIKEGFTFFGGEPEYDYFAPNVNGCDFATLIMKKG